MSTSKNSSDLERGVAPRSAIDRIGVGGRISRISFLRYSLSFMSYKGVNVLMDLFIHTRPPLIGSFTLREVHFTAPTDAPESDIHIDATRGYALR